MPYVDGFLIPIPKKNLAAYRRMAQKASKIWKEYGALEFRSAPLTTWPRACFPRWPGSRKARQSCSRGWSTSRRCNAIGSTPRMMKDPRVAAMMTGDSPFDVKRMAMGGFKVLVDA